MHGKMGEKINAVQKDSIYSVIDPTIVSSQTDWHNYSIHILYINVNINLILFLN